MAYERNPSDPTRSDLASNPYRASDPYRSKRADNELRDPADLDNDLQVDPELAEGRVSGGRIAAYALAIAVILGAVFYGLNNASFNQDRPASTAQNSSPSSPPAAPPGMRDVTPHANSQPGTTTGAAPAHPQTPPSSAPMNADRSGNRPADAPANSPAPGK